MEWQPMETAPKDGRRVLCWNPNWQAPESGCLYGMSWAANGLAADKGGWKYQPTHWMPLPDPPYKADPLDRLLLQGMIDKHGRG